jgi:plasmid maintenance system killer protein
METIKLQNPLVFQKEIIVDSYRIEAIIDNPIDKVIRAFVSLGTDQKQSFTLWGNDQYDNIGQWTDTDAKNKVEEMLNILYKPK